MEKCCSTTPEKTDPKGHTHNHSEGDGHNHDHDHDTSDQTIFQMFLPAIISFAILLLGIAFDNYIKPAWFAGWVRLVWFAQGYVWALTIMVKPHGMRCIYDFTLQYH